MHSNIIFWNPWWQNKEYSFEIKDREIFLSLDKFLSRKEIIFFTGVRRSGKTSTMYYLINKLLNKKNPKKILYLNMDDEVLSLSKLDEIYETYKELTYEVKGKRYIFLDEIQNVEGWERWVKKMYDSFENIKFIISGSKSHVLKKRSTLLTGRMLELEIYPLSFKEFLNFNDVDYKNKISLISNKTKIKLLLEKFIKFGGFPEVVIEQDEHLKSLIGKEYYNNIKDRDIIIFFGVKEARKFDRLSLFLISNIAKPTSANKLGRIVNLSPTVVNNYIDFSEMMYLFLPLQHFNYSLKGQMTKPRKIYSIDTGMVNSIAFQFSENIGRFIENVVYLELKRRGYEIYYYNNRYECDFIIKKGTKIVEAIQVCFKLTEDNLKREQGGLLEAMKEFKLKTGKIITLEKNKLAEKSGLKTISLIDWLLE